MELVILIGVLALIAVGTKKMSDYKSVREKKKEEAQAAIRAKQFSASPEEIERLLPKYLNSPIVIGAAQTVVSELRRKVERTRRDVRKSAIIVEVVFGATFWEGSCEGVGFWDNDYGFEMHSIRASFISFHDHNLQPFKNKNEMAACVKAIAVLSEKKFREQYKRDESGTEYEVYISKREYVHPIRDEYTYAFTLNYFADNGNYQAPREW